MAQQDDSSLLATIIAAFLLTQNEVQQMAEAIYTARLAALTAQYKASASATGVDVPDDWEPPDDVMGQCADDAQTNAKGIASTYATDLTAFATAALAAYRQDHPDATVAEVRQALTQELGTFTAKRGKWKAEQIAAWEAKMARKVATDQLVWEMQNDMAFDDEGNLIAAENYVVVVTPDYSSDDECADYAGNVYALDDYDAIPIPMHLACIHDKDIYLDDGSLYDEISAA